VRNTCRSWWLVLALVIEPGVLILPEAQTRALAQEQAPLPQPAKDSSRTPELQIALPACSLGSNPLPINLPTALKLANVQAVDIAAAAERIRVAAAVLEQAQVLWLPTITVGGDYNRHDGRTQDISGNVFANSRSSMMFGAGTGIGAAAILSVDDAIFSPLAARQQLTARQADLQAASNNTLVAVTDAYFTVEQARGELVGAIDTTGRLEKILDRIKGLVPSGLAPALEADRAEAELARRQEAELLAQERWQVASADLVRVLRLDPSAQVEPLEPPQLRVDLIDLHQPVDDLIPIALTNRPELASQQAQVQATLTLLKQEKLRPLIPSVLLRGFSTPVTGTLAGGIFAGGPNDNIGNAGLRGDLDLQVLWQFNNLGFGNLGLIRQRQAENRLAVINLFRTQDMVAAEVSQAYAQAQLAARRVEVLERGLRSALASADKNLYALRQTKKAGGVIQTLVRPQEAVAAVQALAQAYTAYYGAVADANRAQFRLYRALGQPAQCVLQVQQVPVPSSPPAGFEDQSGRPVQPTPPSPAKPGMNISSWGDASSASR
jgi:outer membrane protein TolC